MSHPYDSARSHRGSKSSLHISFVILSLLMCLLFTPNLFGHPAGASVPAAPTAPSNLTANAVNNARIDLAWSDNSGNENGFSIEIKVGAAGSYAELDVVGANVTSYASTGLDASTQYFYRVRAFNADGNSAFSNEANATTLPDPPVSPSSLTATTISNTQINLSWTDNSNNEDGFKIERKLNSAVTYTQIATVGPNATVFLNTGLATNTGYSYRVRAFNAGGNSGYSNAATATTLPNPPAAPSNLVATAVSNKRIDLAWQDNASDEIGFKIERKAGSGGSFAVIDSVNANVTNYSSANLIGGTQYFYRVRAFNAGGASAYTNEANAQTLPDVPAAPSNLTATAASNDQINLAWTDNSSNEDGFKIEIKIGTFGSYSEIAEVNANTTTYASTGLEAGIPYFYRVRAFNLTGNSSYSNEANAQTLPDPPIAPSNLSATTISNTQINLSWNDNSSNEDGFKIERKLGAAATYTEIVTVGANTTSYASLGLAPNSSYSYRVRAINAGGTSAYSNVASATTFPNAPTAPSNLTATTVSNSQIDLAWQDNANNEIGFIIERKLGAGGAYAPVDTVDANVTFFSSTGLTGSTQYFYRVRAYNTGGSSAYSNEANATTQVDPPGAPTNLTATAMSSARIALAWTDNAGNELGYKIELKIGAAGAYAEIDEVGPNVTSYESTGLDADTQYFYRVRAYSADGFSAYSNEANATTLPDPPTTPNGLTAKATSNTQIDLAWNDNSSNESGFKIERKLNSALTFTQIATVGPNVTTFSSTGLSPLTGYSFRVRAFNASGNSSYSNIAGATTLPNSPAAPSNLTATAVNNRRIDLAWQDNASNELGTIIERKTGASGVYADVDTVGVNVTSFSDLNLAGGTTYFYKVRAYNSGGSSASSNEANAMTLLDPPDAPSNLTATAVSNKRINLAWTDNADNEDGFRIERKIPQGGTGVFVQIATVAPNVTAFSDTALTALTTYFYRIRAFNPDGQSAYSDEANAKTLPNPPNAPSNLTATTVSHKQIKLAWTDNASNEDGYKIERKTGPAGVFAEVATVAVNVKAFSDTSLSENTQFFYRVRAFNTGGNSAYSNEANAKTLLNPPGTPGNLTATTVSNTRIDLEWTDNSGNEDGFKIERKTSTVGSTYAEVGMVGANTSTFSDTGLTALTTYFYRIRAFNLNNKSAYSNEANAKTLPNPPAAPSSLTATTVNHKQINLAWTDNASNEDGYKIERKTGPTGVFAEVATVAANVKAFSDTSLSENTQFFYRVRGFNPGGNSAYSNEANAKTLMNPPGIPGNLTATAVSNSRIDLAWLDNSDNEDGFKIERKTAAVGSVFVEIGTAGANATAFSDSGLTALTTYFYRIRAFNADNKSGYSNETSVKTLPNPPAAPSNLTAATVSNTQIKLAWTDNASNEDGYKIERKTGAEGVYAEIAVVPANVKSLSDTSLTANTQFFYRVRAFNAGGSSAYSNEANAKTLPNPPNAPSDLATKPISTKQINLEWSDNSDNETGFKIERKLATATNFTQIATVGANVTAYADTGLAVNTKYFYRLRAFNAGGHSPFSTAVAGTTLPNPPGAPANLAATVMSSSQIDLKWQDKSGNEAGFKIERKLGNTGTFTQIATVGANVTAFSSVGLNANTKYFFRVRAYNVGGNSPYSNVVDATTLPKAPAAPANLVVVVVSNSRINLAWADKSANEDSFKIERKLGSAGAYAEIARAMANVKSFADTTLNGNTQYFYRVRASNSGGNSAYSNEASATTLPNPPAAPDSLKATAVSQTQINLEWKDQADNEAGFKIERKTTGGAYAQIAALGANATSFADSNLTANTQYFYRVRTHNTGGHSDYSSEASATTLPNPPAAPSALTATAVGSNKINLAWTDNANNEAGFKIERKIGAAGTYAQVALVGANVTSYADAGLNSSGVYFYRVRAHNTGGHSDYSNEANTPTLPAAPAGLAATTVSKSKINLAWVDSSKNEVGFKIERKQGAAGTFAQIATTGANATSFADSGLAVGTTYFYRVRSHNAGGNSPYSNMAEATTLPNPPPAPTSLTATTMINRQIHLAWVDSSNKETGFKIERKTTGGAYAQIASVGANVTSYSDTGLVALTDYFYRVRAFNAGGNSGYSNEATAKTFPNPPVAPSSLAATTISQTQINLAWTDNSSDENGFKIERKTASGAFAEIATVGANVKVYSDNGLTQNTKYFYRVRGYNSGGHSAYSNESNATTLPTAPVRPGSLTATAVSNKRINLAWADSSDNEDGFKIERKKGAAGTYAQIASVGAGVKSYADSTLLAATQYFYRVRAFNIGGHSNYSTEANATTLPNAPKAPNKLTATAVSHSQINLAWADSSNNESGFRIERKTGAAGTYAQIAAVGANVKNYADVGLNATSEYFYRVRAFNAGGNSAYSNVANTMPLPKAPGNLSATAVSNKRINLTWADSSNNESGFKIERKKGAAGTYAQIVSLGANVKSYADTTLLAGTEYFYRVRAFNAGGNSAYSNDATDETLPNPPKTPVNLTATPVSQTKINLAWADSSNNEDGFKIERKKGAAGTYAQIAAVGANVKTYADTSLTGSTQYFYRVRAFNTGGNSNYSNEANATTLPPPPNAPSDLAATVAGGNQINLAWADNSPNETGFKIESKIGEEGTYAEVGSVGANVTSFDHTGLTEGATYFYRVRSFNAGGNSTPSNEVSAIPSSGTNFALNKPVTASSTDSTSAPSRAVDGSVVTFWRSGFVNASSALVTYDVQLNANVKITIGRVVIKWYQTYYATDYEIQVSDDAANWTTIHTNAFVTTNLQDVTFPAVATKNVRLLMKKNNKSNYRIAEIEIYGGVVAKASSETAKTASAAVIPETITLSQNYPNPFGRSPFNPSTTIAYALPEGMHVSLKVFNVAGQEVATLVDSYQDRGFHQVTFNARKLPSGMYYAVLKAGAVTQTKRMVLAK
jgi:titin